MPLVFQQNINLTAKIGVWHITEPLSFFLERVAVSRPISHSLKKLQHLAGRYLLKSIDDSFPLEAICIADNGKPYLNGHPIHFSISHSGEYVAAVIDSSKPVGVDVEKISSKIQAVKHKFIDSDELSLLNQTSLHVDEQITLAWCVKEAVFKWFQKGGVDFISHIRIKAVKVNKKDDISVVCDFLKGGQVTIEVKAIRFENYILAMTE